MNDGLPFWLTFAGVMSAALILGLLIVAAIERAAIRHHAEQARANLKRVTDDAERARRNADIDKARRDWEAS